MTNRRPRRQAMRKNMKTAAVTAICAMAVGGALAAQGQAAGGGAVENGKRILFERANNFTFSSNLYSVSPSGGPVKQLTHSNTDGDPSVAPNGKLIAFDSTRNGKSSQIYLMS